MVPPLLPGLDLVTVVTKCSGGGGLQPPDRAVSSPESSGSGLITLMVGMAAVSASSSSPLSTLLMERSRLPEAALVAGVLAAVSSTCREHQLITLCCVDQYQDGEVVEHPGCVVARVDQHRAHPGLLGGQRLRGGAGIPLAQPDLHQIRG